jgi:hypothetical protein
VFGYAQGRGAYCVRTREPPCSALVERGGVRIMAWLRLYDDILDDPKIQMLSDRAFRMFVNCLALAKRNNGKLPGDMNSLAFSLRLPAGKCADTFQVLLSAGCIDRNDDGTYSPHNWNGRQYESDSAAERMRRYRERNKSKSGDEALRNAQRNSDGIESDTEADTEQKVVERAVRAAPKGTRWPPEQAVSNEWIADADIQRHEHNLPSIDFRLEATKFAHYWSAKSGAGATKLDWHKTWINWALKAEAPRNSGRVSAHDKGTEGAALYLAKVERGNATGHRDRAGEIGSGPRLLASRHGPSEVGDAVRDLPRGLEGPERGTNPLGVQSVAQQSRQHEIPDAGPIEGSVRPVQDILGQAARNLSSYPRGTRQGGG